MLWRIAALTYQHDTYNRRVQLGASRRRREDAEALQRAGRWTGAIYLGGYAIECSLCALICFYEGKNNFKDTRAFKQGSQGRTLHNLIHLLGKLPSVQRAIMLDRTGVYRNAWDIITNHWQKDELRYWDKIGDEHDSERFMNAVKVMHTFILQKLGET